MTAVDIVMPFYGPVGLLDAAITSVLAQDDPRWRLTVVDDASPDPEVATRVTGVRDPRVRYRRNDRNLGLNRNFQRCLDLVEHPLAVVIGCDDVMMPHYVGTVRATHHRHPEAAIVAPGVAVVDASGRPVRTLPDTAKRLLSAARASTPDVVLTGESLAAGLVRGNWLYFPALCWRSSVLRATGFREGLDVVLDLALVLDLVMAGESLVVEPRTSFRYRRHARSVSSALARTGTRFDEEHAFFTETADRMDALGWPRAARAARRHLSSRLHAAALVAGAVRVGDGDGSTTLLRHVLRPGRPARTAELVRPAADLPAGHGHRSG